MNLHAGSRSDYREYTYDSEKRKIESGKLIMKKFFVLLTVIFFSSSVFAFDYVPKNTENNPFGSKSYGGKSVETKSVVNSVKNNQKTEQTAQPEMREIKNLAEYFRYLPAEVHRHWTPYKANIDYEITVQFTVHRDGSISDIQIVGTNYPNANPSALNAVKTGAPYQPLPKSYKSDKVKAQVVLEYHAK